MSVGRPRPFSSFFFFFALLTRPGIIKKIPLPWRTNVGEVIERAARRASIPRANYLSLFCSLSFSSLPTKENANRSSKIEQTSDRAPSHSRPSSTRI